MSKFGDVMMSSNEIEQSNDPAGQRAFLIRHLNNVTNETLKITTHNVLRPNFTIYPTLNKTSQNAADELAEVVHENVDEFLEGINVNSLIALVSTNVDPSKKIPIVNLAIQWLRKNETDGKILNYLLMSISLNFFTVAQIGRIRLAVFLYLTSPELKEFYDIHLRKCGNIFIHRKLGISGDPSDADLYNDEETQVKYCNAVNKVTDEYINPCWPQGTERQEREGPTEMKRRRQLLVEFAPVLDLKNPIYKWDFKNRVDPNIREFDSVPKNEKRSELQSNNLVSPPKENIVKGDDEKVSTPEYRHKSDNHHHLYNRYDKQRRTRKNRMNGEWKNDCFSSQQFSSVNNETENNIYEPENWDSHKMLTDELSFGDSIDFGSSQEDLDNSF
ncbi:hypothetical protein CRE_27077 [Caenorhabditis remanei]|uniref:Uncharacterized protein n=1 Tax=Caenorhabditis remanei TaxID=31234 RepID=E3LQ37_CAERE|nr:hypothetical protein CRE_27077 [Caenorhabditis remanei]